MPNFDSIAEGDIRVVKVADTQILDEDYCHKVGIQLTSLVNEMNESALALNMSDVKFMASAMIGKLVMLRNHCKTKNVGFAICCLGDNVSEAIHLMRIDQILNVHPTQEEAVKSLLAND